MSCTKLEHTSPPTDLESALSSRHANLFKFKCILFTGCACTGVLKYFLKNRLDLFIICPTSLNQ